MARGVRLKPKVVGVGSAAKQLRQLAKEVPQAFAAGLYQEGFALQALSVAYVPVDTGRLRATAYTSPPEWLGKRVVVRVGYGTNYAVYVHEILEARHTVGQARFLVRALLERRSGFAQRLVARVRGLATQGVGVQPLSEVVP